MHIVVTGSLGHISHPLATILVGKGHGVTVISSKPEKQAAIEQLGARAAIGSLEDADFLTATFAGADAVYLMIPPSFGETDPVAYYSRLGRNYVQAIQQAGVKRAVHLSSWGADLDQGTGFILGSHHVEQQLNALPDVAVTHLRAGYIYYNLYNFAAMIKTAGFIGANYGGGDRLVMVAPDDIAAAAADELTAPATGQPIRYVASDERTATETAQVLGQAIGKPGLQWVTFSDEQARDGMRQHHVPEHIIANSIELGASIHSGALRRDYELHRPAALGRVKLEAFAQAFAATFHND